MRRLALNHPLVSHFVASVLGAGGDFEFNREVESLREVSQFEGLLRRASPDLIQL
jgi:hypothetical protein